MSRLTKTQRIEVGIWLGFLAGLAVWNLVTDGVYDTLVLLVAWAIIIAVLMIAEEAVSWLARKLGDDD